MIGALWISTGPRRRLYRSAGSRSQRGIALVAGALCGVGLHRASPHASFAGAVALAAAVYAAFRLLLREPPSVRHMTLLTAGTLFASAFFMAIAGESRPPYVSARGARAGYGLLLGLRILAGFALPILVAAIAFWQSLPADRPRRPTGALAPLAVHGALALAGVVMSLGLLVGAIALPPRGEVPYALLAVLLAAPLVLHQLWTWAYVVILSKWEVEQPEALIAALAEIRSRCAFIFGRVLCLDDRYGNGRTCAVTSSLRTATLLISEGIASKLAPDELVAVLAHEAAHIERRHFPRKLISGALAMIVWIGTAIALGYLISLVAPGRPGLVQAMVVGMTFGYVRALYDARVSRKHEREADEYAAHAVGADAMLRALQRLDAHRLPFLMANRHTTHGTWDVRSAHLRAMAAIRSAERQH